MLDDGKSIRRPIFIAVSNGGVLAFRPLSMELKETPRISATSCLVKNNFSAEKRNGENSSFGGDGGNKFFFMPTNQDLAISTLFKPRATGTQKNQT